MKSPNRDAPRSVAVIGAGVTGLAVGAASGAPVFEQSEGPGGICRSYYVIPGSDERFHQRPSEEGSYRFEVGGGHWIFGGDPATMARLEDLAEFRVYERRAVVRIGALGLTVPYPLQAHLGALGPGLTEAIDREAAKATGDPSRAHTLGEWLTRSFGPTLADLFFLPFHDRYTAGLTMAIAPQDVYKSPSASSNGYNSSFRYPVGGLDALVARLADRCDVRYDKQLLGIDAETRMLRFADGTEYRYDHLLSTLPLHHVVTLAGIDLSEPPDPFTSVLVLNIGAERGAGCPDAHWQYEPDSHAGFHRIGFYSNVDPDFLPAGCRSGSHVSLYVERAFRDGQGRDREDVERYIESVIEELHERDYIRSVEVVDASWVEVAYTWRSPGSRWPEVAIDALAAVGIQQVGRYARWHFQGIAESIREGLDAGRSLTT